MAPIVALTALFIALNMYLWSRPFSHLELFWLTLPLGVLYFVGFFWWVRRQR